MSEGMRRGYVSKPIIREIHMNNGIDSSENRPKIIRMSPPRNRLLSPEQEEKMARMMEAAFEEFFSEDFVDPDPDEYNRSKKVVRDKGCER